MQSFPAQSTEQHFQI